MLTIGLTGGIASGKSTVADLFRELGVPIIDSDQIARAVVEPGTPALNALVDAFDSSLLFEDGSLDRQRLRNMIFNDTGARDKVEHILHPAIRERSRELREQARQQGNAYALVDVPLLVETGQFEQYDRILVIDVDVEIQATRVMSRDNVSREDAMKIIAAQATRDERLRVAHDIIRNEGMLDNLAIEVAGLHAKYLKLAELLASEIA